MERQRITSLKGMTITDIKDDGYGHIKFINEHGEAKFRIALRMRDNVIDIPMFDNHGFNFIIDGLNEVEFTISLFDTDGQTLLTEKTKHIEMRNFVFPPYISHYGETFKLHSVSIETHKVVYYLMNIGLPTLESIGNNT
jgi:hypothetical protein